MVDYLLTVAVSVAAGVAAMIAMFAGTHIGTLLQSEVVPVCLIVHSAADRSPICAA